MAERARAELLTHELLDKDELLTLLSPAAGEREIAGMRRSGALIALRKGHHQVYPAFQIDRRKREVYPEVRLVNEILGAAGDPWGMASWWIYPHARLGVAPMSLLGTPESARLVELAQAIDDDGY